MALRCLGLSHHNHAPRRAVKTPVDVETTPLRRLLVINRPHLIKSRDEGDEKTSQRQLAGSNRLIPSRLRVSSALERHTQEISHFPSQTEIHDRKCAPPDCMAASLHLYHHLDLSSALRAVLQSRRRDGSDNCVCIHTKSNFVAVANELARKPGRVRAHCTVSCRFRTSIQTSTRRARLYAPHERPS